MKSEFLPPAALLMTAALFLHPAWGQETGGGTTPEVVVSATRVAAPGRRIGATSTVKTGEEIARKQQRTVVDVLNDVPGISVVQSGGAGKTTSVFMRGANSEHTLYLLDGIELNNPVTPSRTFDPASLLTGDIARVEVVRGPLSTVHGSDAIGGVISIETRKGDGPPRATVEAEGGSFGTHREVAGVSVGSETGHFAFNFGRLASDDISVTPGNRRPAGVAAENDPYRAYNLSTRFGFTPSDALELDFVGRYVNTRLDTDNSAEDPDSNEITQRYLLRGTAELALMDDRLVQKLGGAFSRHRRRARDVPDAIDAIDPNDFTTGSNETLTGRLVKFDYQASYEFDRVTLAAGVEREDERAEQVSVFTDAFGGSTVGFGARTGSTAGFVEAQFAHDDRFFFTANLRLDRNDDFGAETTWRLAPVYVHPTTGTRLKASYGTAFKAPSLFQLFGVSTSPFGTFAGNPALGPETSESFEAGFEQSLLDDKVRFGGTWFHNDLDGLIVTNATFTSFINLGKARTHGVESFAQYEAGERLSVRVDHTWLVTEDTATGLVLLRRPGHKLGMNVSASPVEGARLSLQGIYVGRRADIDSVTFGRISRGGFFTADLAGSYRIDDRIELFGRIDNLLDRDIQEPDGFQHRGIGVFAGLRATFGPR